MTLDQLIQELEKRDPDTVVTNGFGSGHSDRGDYSNVAFKPVEHTTIGAMLCHAKGILNTTQYGWKGGNYIMWGSVTAHIGDWGSCGEEITAHHFLYWDTVMGLMAQSVNENKATAWDKVFDTCVELGVDFSKDSKPGLDIVCDYIRALAAGNPKAVKDVIVERVRQDAKWGEQNHDPFRYITILGEEYGEMCKAALEAHFGADTIDHLREEAVQTAAVAVAIVECIDRRKWRWSTP